MTERDDDTAAVLATAAHEIQERAGAAGDDAAAGGAPGAAPARPVAAADLEFSRAQVRRLSALVDDLLDHARVDLDALPFRPVAADARAVVQEAVAAFRRGARHRRSHWTCPRRR